VNHSQSPPVELEELMIVEVRRALAQGGPRRRSARRWRGSRKATRWPERWRRAWWPVHGPKCQRRVLVAVPGKGGEAGGDHRRSSIVVSEHSSR
jgi:hypothetical protein